MKLKSFVIENLIYAATLGAALVALGIGFSLTSSTGEQSKLSYEGDLWCVSNYIEARDSQGKPVYLDDGRPRKDERLDDKVDWIRKEQVKADTKEEAEKKATSEYFKPSNAEELRGWLDANDRDSFVTHFNTGATTPGPCVGSGFGNGVAGKWVNDGINEDCFGISGNAGCGFDISKLTLYENKSSGPDPGAQYAKSAQAKQYAIDTLGISSADIRQYTQSEVEDMIRAEVARQWSEISNKHGATQEQAQQAILSYQMHESSSFQMFDANGTPSYTHDSSGDCTNIMSLTNDKFDSKNKRIAGSYDIRYAIYLGVKEHMEAFQSSRVSGEGEQRWRNTIGYVFWPSNPQRYWTDSRGNAAAKAWDHYSNETPYSCSKIGADIRLNPDSVSVTITENQRLENAPSYCPDEPVKTGPSAGEDYQLKIAKQYEQELSRNDGVDSESSEGGNDIDYGTLPDGILDVPGINANTYKMGGQCNRVAAGMAHLYRTGKKLTDQFIFYIKHHPRTTYGIMADIGTGVIDRHKCASSDNWAEIRDQVVNHKNPVVLATSYGQHNMHYITIVGFKGDTVYFNDGSHFVGRGSSNQVKARSINISAINKKLNHAQNHCRYLYAKPK